MMVICVAGLKLCFPTAFMEVINSMTSLVFVFSFCLYSAHLILISDLRLSRHLTLTPSISSIISCLHMVLVLIATTNCPPLGLPGTGW